MRRRFGLLSLVLLAFAFAWPMQGTGFNQNAHYALVRALADGTARLDETRGEVGQLGTRDIHVYEGHYYSDKAPMLAFVSLPAFLAVEAAGISTAGDEGTGDPTKMLWVLGLLGTVLPSALSLFVVRTIGERIEPGSGTAAAVLLGVATLLLPFSGLFFSHALAAFLNVSAFALLFFAHRAERGDALRLAAAGGVVAGLAIATEYPNALVALALGVYACCRRDRWRRALAYGLGVVGGLVPLLAYNAWAFGTPFHLSYAGALTEDVTGNAFFGLDPPSLRNATELLFSSLGLLTVTPVVICGLLGAVLLYRRGLRAEALVCTLVPSLFVVYTSGFFTPFGGIGPPRYLVPVLPFLALPLAVALRAFPAVTVALALVSAVVMVGTTSTYALAGYDWEWLTRLANGDVPLTAASLAGVTGWIAIVPFFCLILGAVVLAFLASAPRDVRDLDVVLAGAAVLLWALLAATSPRPAVLGGEGREFSAYWGAALVLLLTAAAIAATRATRPTAQYPE